MIDRPNSLAARDIAYYFHPATNARRHEQVGPMMIERGEGVRVYDDAGKAYIEGLAGLWSVAVGFGEPRLVKAAAEAMAKLPFYHSFSHKSHPAATKLAERLVAMAPGMAKAHFTSSGSEANDLVVKMIWYYQNALGRPSKKKIISRVKAYHGVTIVAASLTGMPNFHRDFDLPLPFVRHVGCPNLWRYGQPGETEEAFATRLAEELDATIIAEGPETVAAFIGEPVMGAGGVMVPPRTYWQKIQAVCRKYDLLVIADEVITGGNAGAVAKPGQLAVWRDDLEAGHMVDGKAVLETVRAARVLGHVPADRADDLAGRIGRVEVAERPCRVAHRQVGDSRLHDRALAGDVDRDDAPHPRGHDQHPVGVRHGTAGQASARAAGHERDP
ncbi:MAG: aminotransferase class III-fold pyridoxal phosphate-dependent enzyme, partial [Pseudomonadota bacterium]|nr:aminotransferase class III-fold pyridoxal phosphate-dependent enzyme [Pseudomonadota bacterium]